MRTGAIGLADPFYSPFGAVLLKGEEHNGKWEVYLEASNQNLDQEREVILRKALEKASDYYLSHGILSWDHKHKQTGEPKFIIGEPTDVQFVDKRTLVKGWLYQKNEIAQQVWNNIQSQAEMLGASVGGGILRKAKTDTAPDVAGFILRVIWDETAITHKPVNDTTLGRVQLIPFPEFVKALMAGSGTDAASYTGGRALTGESLDESLTDQTFAQTDVDDEAAVDEDTAKTYFEKVLAAIGVGRIKSMNDVVSFTLDQGHSDGVASALIDFIAQKIPALGR